MTSIKRPGCCTRCGTEVYTVVTRYPEGPLHRCPRELGSPLPSARLVHYVLVSGARCSLTSCEDCVAALVDPVNLPALWRQVIATFLFEERDDVRDAMPSAPRTAEQKQVNRTGILQLMTNPPLGVIAVTVPRQT